MHLKNLEARFTMLRVMWLLLRKKERKSHSRRLNGLRWVPLYVKKTALLLNTTIALITLKGTSQLCFMSFIQTLHLKEGCRCIRGRCLESWLPHVKCCQLFMWASVLAPCPFIWEAFEISFRTMIFCLLPLSLWHYFLPMERSCILSKKLIGFFKFRLT